MANKDKQKNFTGTVRCANCCTFSSVTTAGCYIRLHHLLHILYPAGLRNILPLPTENMECILITFLVAVEGMHSEPKQ